MGEEPNKNFDSSGAQLKLFLEQIWHSNRLLVISAFAGLFLLSIGLYLILQPNEPPIEIIPVEELKSLNQTIFVDLQGAVGKPGLYELPADSRVNHLLVQAGGLSPLADRDWVAKNINLAQLLADGTKIYIPKKGETLSLEGSGKIAGQEAKIDINTASASQLDTLWGIGPKRAMDIIKNRPYSKVEELLNKKVIPQSIYEKIKEEIAVY